MWPRWCGMDCPASGAHDLLPTSALLAKRRGPPWTLQALLTAPTVPPEGTGRWHSLSVGHISGRRHCCVVEVFVFIHPDLRCPAGVPENKASLPEL